MITIGKTFTFEAAHSIPGHPTCGHMHGHTWTLTVMMRGNVKENGMLIDFKVLSNVVKEVIDAFDHKVINEVLDRATKPITAETLVELFAFTIYGNLPMENREDFVGCRLQEGPGGWAEFWIQEEH